MEPRLDVDDIQGHIFPGFGTKHSVVVALAMRDPTDGRQALAGLLPSVTTMEHALREKDARRNAVLSGKPLPAQVVPSLALAFAATALHAWGHDSSRFDRSFHAGMLSDAGALGDPRGLDSIPADWTFNTGPDDRADVLLVAGHSDQQSLDETVEEWLAALSPQFEAVLVERGRRRDGDKEFFGFRDGISQPAMRGVTPSGEHVSQRAIDPTDPRSKVFAKPGQQLVWPGSFLFGYPQQSTDPLRAGMRVPPAAPFIHNGSYLVFRRLLQNVPAFREVVQIMEGHLANSGEQVPPGWVAARLVGRWPDGTPLTASPDKPNSAISGSPNRINNFRFQTAFAETRLANASNSPVSVPAVSADPLGFACPRASHIRQVNPRDGTSEIGSEHHAKTLMLRRGITFGPEFVADPDADRGLLFLAYQTSIVDQFRFVQANWANGDQRPTGDGRDPIIGQDGTAQTQRQIQLFAPSRRQRQCPLHGRWVVATGGEYFVTPGIKGLRHLLHAE